MLSIRRPNPLACRLMLLSFVLSLPAGASTTKHITAIEVANPGAYGTTASHQSVTRTFLETNRDAYDFVVIFPSFPVAHPDENTLGTHSHVRNQVSGIGLGPIDVGADYGSGSRLKGVIHVDSLVPGSPAASHDGALGIIAHEVAHQWSGRVTLSDVELLGHTDAHWSFFLDTQGSVLYGAGWTPNEDGTFTSHDTRLRYSPLDLYLMGFLRSDEVPPMALIEGATDHDRTDIPPLSPVTVEGTQRIISIDDLIFENGPRIPDFADSQKEFRAAFVIAHEPGAQPTAAQTSFVDAVRQDWAMRFFVLTQGRAIMQTELLDATPDAISNDPSIFAGVHYLLEHQCLSTDPTEPSGRWVEGNAYPKTCRAIDSRGELIPPTMTARETQLAIEALRLFPGMPSVSTSISAAASWLSSTTFIDADSLARRALGLVAAGTAIGDLTTSLNEFLPPPGVRDDAGLGLLSGYTSGLLDSTLAARAWAADGAPETQLTEMETFVTPRPTPS